MLFKALLTWLIPLMGLLVFSSRIIYSLLSRIGRTDLFFSEYCIILKYAAISSVFVGIPVLATFFVWFKYNPVVHKNYFRIHLVLSSLASIFTYLTAFAGYGVRIT